MATTAIQANQEPKITRWLGTDKVRNKFAEVLDKGADAFIASLLSLINETPQLKTADPESVLMSALTAATLKLPINKNLGFAYIVPYKGKAQFQMGWRGYVQLAERTGQYKTIHADVVYEGQIEDIDFVTGKIIRGKKTSNKIVGYVAYIEMINGFSKTLYMDKETMQEHARTYSQSYAYDLNNNRKSSVWSTNFDAMATKTVLKILISKYGIMSVDTITANMATALSADSAIIGKNNSYDYMDNGANVIDGAAQEVNADVETAPAEEEAANNPTPAATTDPATDNPDLYAGADF